MESTPRHPWTSDTVAAMRLQTNLSMKVVVAWDGRMVNTIGGVDTGYTADAICAAVAIFSYPGLEPLGSATAERPITFPYLPGLLAFRVAPAILAAWEQLASKPDLLLVHGHGIAHPRHFGLASHLGVWLDLPTIGVAKSRLYGSHAEVGTEAGAWSEITDEEHPSHILGAALRTRPNAQPIFISPGHLVDIGKALDIVCACCRGYRLPEPLRFAYQAATRASHRAEKSS